MYRTKKQRRTPFERTKKVSERITTAALNNGLVIVPGTCGADGTVGDLLDNPHSTPIYHNGSL